MYLLNEPMRNEDLQRLDVSRLLAYQLQEKLVDWLQVGPRGVDQQILLLHDGHSFGGRGRFLEDWQRTEEVLLDHLHDQLQVGDDQSHETVLLIDELDQLLEDRQTLVLGKA